MQAVQQVDSWFPKQEQIQARQQAHVEATTSLMSALHATGNVEGAAAQCQRALDLTCNEAASNSLPGPCIAAAVKQAAAFRLAQVLDILYVPTPHACSGTDSTTWQ